MDEIGDSAAKPSSNSMRVTTKVFMWLTAPPALLGVFLIDQDTKQSDEMFDGLGYFLGGGLLVLVTWALFCYGMANRRVTFRAQLIWFLLAFAPAVTLLGGVTLSQYYFSSAAA